MIGITYRLSDSLKNFISENQPDKIFVLCDANVIQYCLPAISVEWPLEIIEIAEGERCKNLTTCENIWEALANGGATRNSLLVCLGGGSTTDLGGFVASTYQRGIKVCYIPTTLLCMVDAAIGGKTGINLGGLKNYIGTFRMPDAVLVYPEFLRTLPDAEWQNGKAEMIKHALLSGKGWTDILQNGFPDQSDIREWSQWIEANMKFKTSIISEDFAENNIRAMLNFGHTAAHALEFLYMNQGRQLSHGQAVAAGILIETIAASMMEVCPVGLLDNIRSCIHDNFDPVAYNPSDVPELNMVTRKDKKSKSGNIVCSVIAEAGKPSPPLSVPETVMYKAWLQYLHETA